MELAHSDRSVEAWERLSCCLEAERELTASLLAALQAERASIVSGRLAELYSACRERAELVARVRASQEATALALSVIELGAEPGEPEGLSAAISRMPRPKRPRFRCLREEINRLRREVAALSEENSLCVAEALEYIDSVVAILTGAETEPATYGETKAGRGPAVISSEV